MPANSLRAQISRGIQHDTQTIYLPMVAKEFDMTQISRPQQGRYVTYPDCGGYTANQWARVFRLLTNAHTTRAVFGGYLDEMEVTNPIGVTIRVASGAALVNGHYCFNEDQTDPALASNVNFVPSTPGADRIDKVVLVQNNTDTPYTTNLEFPTDLTDYAGLSSIPAHSCRLAILTGVEGAAARDLVQDVAVDGDIWMIELSRYTITNAPLISVEPIDYRDFIYLAGDRTRSFFVPVSYGTVDKAAPLPTTFAVELIDGATTTVGGAFQVPHDYKSNLVVSPVYIASGGAGDVRVSSGLYYGAIDESPATHNDLSGASAETVVSTLAQTVVLAQTLTAPTAGDVVQCSFIREGGHGTDSYAATIYFIGWIVEYTADS